MDTALLATFSVRLRETRGDMMQATFAQRIGVSRASLSSYENGTRIPDIETLKRIHEETGVSIYYLLGLTDSKDDTFATTQRDTGLSEEALSLFSHDPIITDCINMMARHGILNRVCMYIAILYNDHICRKGISDANWTDTMESHRNETIDWLIDDLMDTIEAVSLHDSAVQIAHIDEQKLPCHEAISFFTIINHKMQALQLLKEQGELPQDSERILRTYRSMLSDKNGNIPDQHLTWPVTETFCQPPEVINDNGKETPEQ